MVCPVDGAGKRAGRMARGRSGARWGEDDTDPGSLLEPVHLT